MSETQLEIQKILIYHIAEEHERIILLDWLKKESETQGGKAEYHEQMRLWMDAVKVVGICRKSDIDFYLKTLYCSFLRHYQLATLSFPYHGTNYTVAVGMDGHANALLNYNIILALREALKENFRGIYVHDEADAGIFARDDILENCYYFIVVAPLVDEDIE